MTNSITFKQKWFNFLKAIGAPIPSIIRKSQLDGSTGSSQKEHI